MDGRIAKFISELIQVSKFIPRSREKCLKTGQLQEKGILLAAGIPISPDSPDL